MSASRSEGSLLPPSPLLCAPGLARSQSLKKKQNTVIEFGKVLVFHEFYEDSITLTGYFRRNEFLNKAVT